MNKIMNSEARVVGAIGLDELLRRRAELVRNLRELAKWSDREAAHNEADKALLAYINDAAITKAYEDGDFCW